MTQFNGTNPESTREAKLPRRDWILLPLISLMTTIVVAVALNLTSAHMFVQNVLLGDCITIDPVTGERGLPNHVCRNRKTAESQPVDYIINSCGHRAGMECGPKPPDTYRIVMVGSSYSFGYTVRIDETLATLLPLELSRRTGRKVELYNESMMAEGGIPRNVDVRFNQVLAAHPDAILWMLTPWEFTQADPGPRDWDKPGIRDLLTDLMKHAMNRKVSPNEIPALAATIQEKWMNSKTGVLVEHYLYQFNSVYVKLYLENGEQSGFLRVEPDAEWQYRLHKFDGYAGDIIGRANAAGVPVIVALLPNRFQAAMISMDKWPPGTSPYRIGEELRAIVTSHGATYIDILPDLRRVPNLEQDYETVDNHPTAAAHAVFSRILAEELTNGSVPALKASGQSQIASKQER